MYSSTHAETILFLKGVFAMSFWDEDGFNDFDIFDPLRVERSAPMDDREANAIESLCLAATPGRLVVDDEAEGVGVVVASLPDGRHVINLTPTCPPDDESAVEANVKLICQARYLLLRMIRDREHLHKRIAELEADLQPVADSAGQPRQVAVRPR